MKLKTLKLTEIQPYENNPFIHSKEDLNNIKNSIQNNEYLNPIIVDKDNVIIAGHLRYQALSELNSHDTEITVVDASHLSPEQVRKYRIFDNPKKPIVIDSDKMAFEIDDLYDDLEKLYEETGLEKELFEITDNIDTQFNEFEQEDIKMEPVEMEKPPVETKNSLEISRSKSTASIKFDLPIDKYELYSKIKRDVMERRGVSNIGDLFMLYFMNDLKEFGLEI